MTTSRDRLIDSARELLAERGYSATSPRAVMDRSGAGQGSFYHHFTDKADLGRAALARTSAEFRSDWDDLLSAPGTARERIVSCFSHADDDVTFGCPIGRLTQDEGVMTEPRLTDAVEASLSWLVDRLHEVIRAGVRDGELDSSIPAAALASTIAALLQGCYVMSRTTHDAQPFRDAHQAVDVLLAGVSPGKPARAG